MTDDISASFNLIMTEGSIGLDLFVIFFVELRTVQTQKNPHSR